ncbi:MAG TPA: hypothetical protein VIC26_02125, partial [Marinagarivorans sp.]
MNQRTAMYDENHWEFQFDQAPLVWQVSPATDDAPLDNYSTDDDRKVDSEHEGLDFLKWLLADIKVLS